ncbi:ribosomal-protein-alanine acetyltransferase [Marinobacterium nitratireducens]|uniref:[Ribosomal protein bS18]-alanine N-acetyltransferase n=1 Tax=Marinobacterium nitratireducens TaxID=518897 RepID=A0A918DQY1_9GAMM|nr:ribosomal protein S18-alanine N-acetyltransferase [Marinobacterium nitratireducens]GGO78739.1 ribosomal-protein-alanine acetyltransferase [Marinobacterium nitratireducens]
MAEVRALSAAHLTALSLLEASSFEPPWSETLLQRQLGQPGGFNLGLFEGDELLAFALCSRLFDEAELLQIAVQPARRREGLGRQLLEEVMARLAGDGCERLMLEVRASNAAGLSLYRILGFAEDGRRKGYYASGSGREDAVLMSRILSGTP